MSRRARLRDRAQPGARGACGSPPRCVRQAGLRARRPVGRGGSPRAGGATPPARRPGSPVAPADARLGADRSGQVGKREDAAVGGDREGHVERRARDRRERNGRRPLSLPPHGPACEPCSDARTGSRTRFASSSRRRTWRGSRTGCTSRGQMRSGAAKERGRWAISSEPRATRARRETGRWKRRSCAACSRRASWPVAGREMEELVDDFARRVPGRTRLEMTALATRADIAAMRDDFETARTLVADADLLARELRSRHWRPSQRRSLFWRATQRRRNAGCSRSSRRSRRSGTGGTT